MTDSITPAKLTKTIFQGVHIGWESQDGTITASRLETAEWEIRRASAAGGGIFSDFGACETLRDARVVIAHMLRNRTPRELENDLYHLRMHRELEAKINSGS